MVADKAPPTGNKDNHIYPSVWKVAGLIVTKAGYGSYFKILSQGRRAGPGLPVSGKHAAQLELKKYSKSEPKTRKALATLFFA
jgi:hypothetical protein